MVDDWKEVWDCSGTVSFQNLGSRGLKQAERSGEVGRGSGGWQARGQRGRGCRAAAQGL